MLISRKEIGYTIYSRLEESLRMWIGEKLLDLYGSEWINYIPIGVLDKVHEKLDKSDIETIEDPLIILDEINIPDLMEIVCYKNAYKSYVNNLPISVEEFRGLVQKLYEIRCKIAHVKQSFSAIDLDLLFEIANSLIKINGVANEDLTEVFDLIRISPEKISTSIPTNFLEFEKNESKHITNLPLGDYDPDGGFIGRKNDINQIIKYVTSDQDRVITISGAGGVGKSAIAHYTCKSILSKPNIPFDAIVWVSAKEEKLTIAGIERIEPTLKNYESVLDSILETFGWYEDMGKAIEEKEESVNIILQAGDKGIILVVDNLETIVDERIIGFIKDIPRPSKVLITSRIGLGEIERRYQLKELITKDAVTLLRTVAREKGVETLAKLSDEILSIYVDRMSRYPLAIKWVVGQVAIGKDIDTAMGALTSSSGDVTNFCFEHIFNNLLDNESRMVLFSLSAYQKSLTRGVLTHITNLPPTVLDIALKDLTRASLVIPIQTKSLDNTIETKYELLPLTYNYLQSKLQSRPDIHREIMNRTEMVQNLIEEAERAGKQYRYSLSDMGAQSDEEKIAATWANTAYQKYQAGDYDGALDSYKRAVEIAPQFPAVYRNWATMESDAGFYEKAEQLMIKATHLDQSDSRLWFVWGNIEKRRQRYERAFEYMSKALAISPNDAPILGALGEIEKRRGNFEEADMLLRKALICSHGISQRRHEIICNTAIADNLRRWADSIAHDKQYQEAIFKLKEAYEHISKVYELDKDDIRAQNSYIEVSKDLGIALLQKEGLESAMPYLNKAISQKPKRANEKKTTSVCCLFLAEALLKEGKVDEAKKYYNIGKKSLFSDSNLIGRYKEISIELFEERVQGILFNVFTEKGFGFIEPNNKTGQTIFVHISDFYPKITNEDFSALKGATLTFNIEKTDKGLQARRIHVVEK